MLQPGAAADTLQLGSPTEQKIIAAAMAAAVAGMGCWQAAAMHSAAAAAS